MYTASLNLERLRFCGCGAAFLPHRRTQQSCSRHCAALARAPRPRSQRRRVAAMVPQHHQFILRLLDVQPLERRARGGWRFGTRRVSEKLVARLIASGRAEIRGEQLHATETRI